MVLRFSLIREAVWHQVVQHIWASWVGQLLSVFRMFLKCTKTSGPCFCSIKPKPLSALNHLTVPVVIVDMIVLFVRLDDCLVNKALALEKVDIT